MFGKSVGLSGHLNAKIDAGMTKEIRFARCWEREAVSIIDALNLLTGMSLLLKSMFEALRRSVIELKIELLLLLDGDMNIAFVIIGEKTAQLNSEHGVQ